MSHRYSSTKKASLLVVAVAVFSFGLVGLSTDAPELFDTPSAAAHPVWACHGHSTYEGDPYVYFFDCPPPTTVPTPTTAPPPTTVPTPTTLPPQPDPPPDPCPPPNGCGQPPQPPPQPTPQETCAAGGGTWTGYGCWNQPSCPAGQHWVGQVNGSCVADTPTPQETCAAGGGTWTGYGCWNQPSCPAGQHWVGQVNGSCVADTPTPQETCAAGGGTWTGYGCWNQPSCPAGQHWVGQVNGSCVDDTPPVETACLGGGTPDAYGDCPAPQLYVLTHPDTGDTVEFWSAVDNACNDLFGTYEVFPGHGTDHGCDTPEDAETFDSAPSTDCPAGSHSHGLGLHPSNVGNVCHQHSCHYGHGGAESNPTSDTQTCDTDTGTETEEDDTTTTTTTTTTTPPTTTTTTPPVHGCAGGQHRDGGTGTCHPHPAPTTCGTTYTAINAGVHSTETTPACPTGRWVDTCPAPASGMHGHTFWQPTSLPWPADAQPYGSHGCADHTPPACANTGPTDYWVSDTSIFSEYTWPAEGPRPTEMMTRLRAGEIFFHTAATVPQCQPENTCPSNPARGHVPASLTDTSYSGHGCDPHPVPACPKYGDTAPTYYVHDPAGSDTWPGHRQVTLDTHHNNGDTHCHTVPVCVPESVVAEAAANTNPKPLQDYDGPDGVPPREYWHFGPTWGSLAGSWLHYGDGIYTGTYIPECPPAPPPPGPGTVTVTVTAPYRLVHGGLLHPETFTAAVTGFNCTGFCGDGTGPVARIETVDFGLTLTATNGFLREPDQAAAGTGQYAVKQCVPAPTNTTLAAECTAAAPNNVHTTDRVVAVVGLFYNATNEESTVAGSQRVHPQITGFAGTYRYWFTQNGAVTSATAPLTVTVVSTAGTDGQKVWSSLIVPD